MNERITSKNFKRGTLLQGKGLERPSAAKSRREDTSRDEPLLFERLISDLSARFVRVPPERVDEEIVKSLLAILEFFRVDICALVRVQQDGKLIHVSHASYAEGIEEVPEDLNLAPLFPWSARRNIEEGEQFLYSQQVQLPPEADRDLETLRGMGALSDMHVPLYVGDRVPYIIALQDRREDRVWPEEFLPRLQLLGEIFVNALERRKIDAALRESEERLRDITFSMADWIWEVDDNGVYTYSSSKGFELLGPVIGKTPFDFMPPDEAERVAAIFSEIAANKAPIKDLENWNIGKDGESICLLTNGVPILDEEGNLKGYRGVDKDITERRRMEELLRASQEKFRQFFKNTPDYCYIISRDGTILNVNDSALQALGYEREEMIGNPVSMIYESGSHTKMEKLFAQWKTSGQLENEEMIILTKHGEKRTVLLNVGSVRDKDGTVMYSTSVQTDITERKRAEEARMESMERYRAVVEAFDGFIYICSLDYRMEFMNQSLIERTGRNAVGEMCFKALHDRDSICEWCVNERVFQGETVRWEVQSPKDHRWYYVVNTPIRHADGTISKQAMILDITERKQAEEALKETDAALRHSQKDLQRLAGRLIAAQEEELRRLSRELHDDLTQRLAVLAIEAGKLELDLSKIPEPCQETLQTISQIKDQLIKVSEDVHNISRQIHPTILDDLGLVRAIESECATLMRRENIEIIFRKEDVPDMIPPNISLCLYRIVQEGLKNIVTHSRSQSCEIFLKGTDNTLCLTVTDDGAGFDPAEVRNKPGLGLASMRERVQLIQGEFSIKSQTRKGTVINVRVPLTGGEA